MSALPAAEAVFKAHQARATGEIRMRAGGRVSVLGFKDGDLVAADVTFGYQGMAQSLLGGHRIDLSTLDALWARGEAGKLGEEDLHELGTSTGTAHELHLLSNVRSVAGLANDASFKETAVEPAFDPLPGMKVARAAFEAGGPELDDAAFRCADVAACEGWLQDEGDRELLMKMQELAPLSGLTATQAALLRMLDLAGKLERVEGEEWRRREAERLAEEERVRAEAEAEAKRIEEARLAEEKRQAEEAMAWFQESAREEEARRVRAEQERAAEEARKAEEARLAEERRIAEEARKAEEARLALEKWQEEERQAEKARQAEEARLAEEKRLEEERLAEEARQAEEARLAEEKRLEEERLAEEARQAEEARLAEERRLEEERLAEEARQAEEARLAEEQRQEEDRRAAEARQAGETGLADQKQVEEAWFTQEQPPAEEKRPEDERLPDAAGIAEEKWTEEERLAEARREEESRQAAQQRLAEEQWAADEARRAEEQRSLEAQWFTPDPQSTWSQPPAEPATDDEAARHRDLTEDAARIAEAMRLAAENLGAPEEPPAPALLPLITAAEPALPSGPNLPTSARVASTDLLQEPPAGAIPEAGDWRTKTDPGLPPGISRHFTSADTDRIRVAFPEEEAPPAPEPEPIALGPAEIEPVIEVEPEPEPELEPPSHEDEERAMREARALAQQGVLRDLQESLLRSATADDDSWLQDSPAWSSPPEWAPPAAEAAAPEPAAPEEPPAISPAEPPATTEPGWGAHFPESSPAAWMPMDVQPTPLDEATIELPPQEALPPAPPPIPPPLAASTETSTDPNVPAFPWQPISATPAEKVWTINSPGETGPAATPAAGAARQPEADLWRIVSFDQSGQDQLSASFEEALKRVDAHLENIVGFTEPPVAAAGGVEQELPPEALVEAEIQPDPPHPLPPPIPGLRPGDIPAPSDETWSDQELSELEEFLGEDELVAGDPSDPAEAAKLRRQRLLRRAMENLGTPIGPRPPGPAPSYQAATQPAAPVAPAAPPGPRSPEEEHLAEQIEARHRQLRGGTDHFGVLGLGRDASKDQVKAAFLGLAKIFHPDRLPPSLVELAPRITAVFEAIREAYEVLYDDAKRTSYLMTLKSQAQAQAASGRPPTSGPAASRAATDAADIYKKGEILFKKRDFGAAEEQYDRAYALDPRATYLAAKAWAIYMDPARKAEGARAKQLMNDAVRSDPLCDRAHYQLGVIARVEGDMDRAERHFREAVKANPKHLEANQELRLIEMRKKNAPPKKGGGLFGR